MKQCLNVRGALTALATLACLIGLLCALALTAHAARTVVDSGNCGASGSNVTWTLYDDGELVISGSGAMKDYSHGHDAPWYNSTKTVTIGSGVTSIGSCAFYYCTSLTSVTIPDSVTSIEGSAFYGCSGLLAVYYGGTQSQWNAISIATDNGPLNKANLHLNGDREVWLYVSGTWGDDGTWQLYDDGALLLAGSGALYGAPWNNYRDAIRSATLPAGMTSVSYRAFRDCDALTAINVAAGNQSYKSVDGVLLTKDGTELIQYPRGKARAYTVPVGVTSIGSYAFYGCKSLTGVTIPSSVTTIESWAFSWCSSLTSVTIPAGVTSIGEWAFSYCTSLTSVTISDSVTSIGNSAFRDCDALTAINVAAGNQSYKSVDGVLLTKDGTELIQYPGGKTGAYTVPVGVTSIGSYAFEYCRSLTSVTIGSGVTVIWGGAFRRCTSLKSVTISDSVTSIGNSAFRDCDALTAINVAAGNQSYKSVDGVLLTKDGTELIQYPGGKTGAYTIPAGVTSIENNAFSFCTSLTSVTIPEGVTSIGDGAFGGCTSLTELTIPEGLTSIKQEAFRDCTSLTSVTIPAGVTSIGDGAFYGCTLLTSVTIPDSVTAIEWLAFEDCTSLTDVYYGGTRQQWDAISIGSYNAPLFGAALHLNSTGPELPAGIPGDLSGDGKVNAKDIVFLQRYVAGGYDITLTKEQADLNRDNKVNAKDIVVLQRFVAGGYDVVLE